MASLLLAAVVLLTGCGGGADARIRRVYELGRSPTEPNKNHLEAMLIDPDRDVRASVLVVMETIDPMRASRLAGVAIDDGDGFVRAAAVRILGAAVASDPALLRRLAAQSGGDSAWQVRRQALEAISSVDDPVVGVAFAHALADPVPQVRATALRGGIARPGLLPVDLVSALIVDDPAWENRVEAARVLAVSKDPAAYAVLEQTLRDPNEFVRAAAMAGRRGLERDGVPAAGPPPEDKPRIGV